MIRHGQRSGTPGSPVAFETEFGWVCGSDLRSPAQRIATHVSLLGGDDILRQFWEVEEKSMSRDVLTPDERLALDHFNNQYTRMKDGRFIVPLPRKPGAQPLGETRSQAVRRFISFECSLHSKGYFREFKAVMNDTFKMDMFPELIWENLYS